MLIDGTKRKEDDGENTTLNAGVGTGQIQGTNVQANPSQAGQPTRSGSFTNLNQYLDINKGNVAQTVGNLQNQIAPKLQETQSLIGNAERTGQDIRDRATSIRQDQDFVRSAIADPTKVTKDPNSFQRFQTIRNSFNSELPSIQPFQNQMANANARREQTAANLQRVGTTGGLIDTIRDVRSNPNYSRGSQALDTFLIQGTDEGQKGIQNIMSQGQQLANDNRLNELYRNVLTSKSAIDPEIANAQAVANLTSQARTNYQKQLEGSGRENAAAFDRDLAAISPQIEETAAQKAQLIRARAAQQAQIDELNRASFGDLRSRLNFRGQDSIPLEVQNQLDAIDAETNRKIGQNIVVDANQDLENKANVLRNYLSQSQRSGIANLDPRIAAQAQSINQLNARLSQMQNERQTKQFFTPEEIERYKAFSALTGEDPTEFLGRRFT